MASVLHRKGFMQSYAVHLQMAPSLQQCGQTALAVATALWGRWALGNHVDSPQVRKPRSSSACEAVLRGPQRSVERVPSSTSHGTWQHNPAPTAGDFMLLRVKAHWGNFNHSGWETKPYLWIIKSFNNWSLYFLTVPGCPTQWGNTSPH